MISTTPPRKGGLPWHPGGRLVNSDWAVDELQTLPADIRVAVLTGRGNAGSEVVGEHLVRTGPLPNFRAPAGDLLDYDMVLVEESAAGADRLASEWLSRRHDLNAAIAAAASEIADQAPLYGLVLAGGRSSRMGRDKATLEVADGMPQAVRLARLLESACDKVFLSVRPGQHLDIPGWDPQKWPLLADSVLEAGPLGGIVSAQRAHPSAAWLVIACDLPNVNTATVLALLTGRQPLRYATAFQSTRSDFPEPLCAIYEPKSMVRLLQYLAAGCQCPTRVLNNSRIGLLEQKNPRWLDNMNEPADFAAAAAYHADKESK